MRPKVEVGRFVADEAGDLVLVNRSGFALARAPPGALIPTLDSLPGGLSTSIQITPVFLSHKGGCKKLLPHGGSFRQYFYPKV